MIIATAGHVDHGKTSLVKALTNVDTDRLPEEKRRGMTIDLGFAYVDADRSDNAAASLGFVDVPGHERFIANMLAGVAAIDVALLVVAADDGPMPQTREHLAILRLLGVTRCVVALTKIDRVSPQRLADARGELAALLALPGEGRFADAPVFELVATTGEGVPALRRHLDALAAAWPARRVAGNFRLAVDRSFLLAGAGRVVTGAVLSGEVQAGERLIVTPHGTDVRVRGLHVGMRPAEVARAGDRCALNLAGSAMRDAAPQRGDWIVAPAAHAPTDRLDVRLHCVDADSAPLVSLVPLAPLALLVSQHRCQLHLGAAAVPARVTLLAPAPGGALAQLVLERPVAAAYGDRFVLRDPAAGRLIAGGRVVDPFAPARGRASAARLARLDASTAEDAGEAFQSLLDVDEAGVALNRFALARNLTPTETEALCRLPGVTVIRMRAERWAMATRHWQAACDRLRGAVALRHADEPECIGPTESTLAERLGGHAAVPLLHPALDALVADGTLVREGLRVRLTGHRAQRPAADEALLARVAVHLEAAGLRPPIVGELAALLDLPQAALLEFLARAARHGSLVRVAPNRYFLPHTVMALADHAAQLTLDADGRGFDAATFRDRTGIGRNLTVQVLEFLDGEGMTRFDARGGSRRFESRQAGPESRLPTPPSRCA